MLFTGCSVLAGEGTLIIKASHKGKHHGCILIHGAAGSGRISSQCSQQDCCGERESRSLWIRGHTHFIRWLDLPVGQQDVKLAFEFFKTSRSSSCIQFRACAFSLPVLWIRVSGFCLCRVAGFTRSWFTCRHSVEEFPSVCQLVSCLLLPSAPYVLAAVCGLLFKPFQQLPAA